jgi:hypothetical protein
VTSVFRISFDFNEKSVVPIVAWCNPIFLVLFALIWSLAIFRFVLFDFRSVQRMHSPSRSSCRRSDPVLFLLAVQRAVPSRWSARESLALSVRGEQVALISVLLLFSVDLVRQQKLDLAAFFSLVILNWLMGNGTCSSQKLSFCVWLLVLVWI